MSSKPFTSLTAETVFKQSSRVKRELLKSKIPFFRHIEAREVHDHIAFKCYYNGANQMEIEVSNITYGFQVVQIPKHARNKDRVRTIISKFSGNRRGAGASEMVLLKKTNSTLTVRKLTEQFIKTKLNRKTVFIKYLSILSRDNIMNHFHPIKATIECFWLNSVARYVPGSLRVFEKLQRLENTIRDMPIEMMDDVLHLNVPKLELEVERFPDDRHLHLSSKKLEIQEDWSNCYHYDWILRKLASGVHEVGSYYKVMELDEQVDNPDALLQRIMKYIPNSRFHVECNPQFFTISISEELELVVTVNQWGHKAIVSEKRDQE